MSYSDPLVTAVIPVYNHEKYVVESIQSIMDQTYRNVELIIINDGSKDRSHEMVLTMIRQCEQRFVRFEYINRENIGLSATLNQALAMANGKYFSGLASDDVALPEKFSLLVEALESRDDTYAAAFGNALFINGSSEPIYLDGKGSPYEIHTERIYSTFLDFYTRTRDLDYRSESFGTYKTLLAANYLPAMSNIVKTRLIEEVGGWTEGNIVEDWEMWLKLSKKFNLAYVDRPLALYRLHGLNSCSTSTDKLLYSSFLLIAGEKEYCAQNNLMPAWENSSHSHFYDLLKNKQFLSKDKLPELMSVPVLPFISFLLRKSRKRIARNLFHMQD